MIRFVWLAAALIVFTATPADAAFIAAAVTAISGWLGGLGAVGLLGVRIVTGLAMNAIGRAMQKRAMRRMQQEQRGIRTSMTLTGGENPDGMIMGVYATAGSFVAPWVMHGASNNYNSQVIDLSGVPLTTLRRVYVNGSPIDLGTTDAIIEGQNFGKPATGTYAGHLWVRFYDGTQTAADPMLVARGASDPDFPWSADMVGMGRAYVICTYLYNREIWQGVPQFRFELGGARFYDMRKDGSHGGVGAHRLNNSATWEGTDNPIVAVAHLAMGYELPDGSIYGGGYTLADLPLSDWAAAMNACDALVAGTNGQEPAWRAGFEFTFDEEPLDAINSLLQVCDGEIADVGGRLYVKVGAPGLPVAFITDDDLIVSEAEDLDPFPGLQQTINGISISHPDPSAAWENTEAPRILDAALEADDGGRRLIQSLALPACPYPLQAQRLGQALLKDARRFARHTLHLPGDLARVRPLQTISWTSARNGYTNKLFELTEQAADLYSYQSQVTLREVDPSDYNPEAYLPLPTVSTVVTTPAPAALEGVSVIPVAISNSEGDARPAIRVSWSPLSAEAVEIEISLGGEVIAAPVAPAAAGRAVISENILPFTQYSVRLRIVPTGRPTAWAGPFLVTTQDLRIGTLALRIGSVTLAGVAGSSAVTNNSSTWTTVASFTLPNLPASGFLQGTVSFRLTAGQSSVANYPTNAEWRVTVNGNVANFIPRGAVSDRNSPFFFTSFTETPIGPGNVTVVFEMRNMGGFGVNVSNLFAQAALR